MTYFIFITAIGALAMLVISRPLFTKTATEIEFSMHAAQTRKEALEALNELEYDYEMKKISKEDYDAMSLSYKQLAMQQMMKEKEAFAQKSEATDRLKQTLEDEIERELQARLKGSTSQ